MNSMLNRMMDFSSLKIEHVGDKWKDYSDLVDKQISTNKEMSSNKFLPSSGGTWTGQRGESTWRPNPDGIPKKDNMNNQTWKEILDKYKIDGIEYKDGYPDFYPISVAHVEIDDFSTDRQKNFAQADENLSKKWSEEGKIGKKNWTAQDVRQYRQENSLTWHEHQDCKTMQLVPKEIHNNIPHEGGICVKKQQTILARREINEYS